jgi:hypothetical protein
VDERLGRPLTVSDPESGESLGEVMVSTGLDVDGPVDAASEAFKD